MEAIIALVIAVIGCKFCNMDFCTLFTFISTSILLYKKLIDYTNDETTRR